jgi:hypothetical protein
MSPGQCRVDNRLYGAARGTTQAGPAALAAGIQHRDHPQEHDKEQA